MYSLEVKKKKSLSQVQVTLFVTVESWTTWTRNKSHQFWSNGVCNISQKYEQLKYVKSIQKHLKQALKLKLNNYGPTLMLMLYCPAGVLTVSGSRAASWCARRCHGTPGRCFTKETGPETDPPPSVCAALRTSDGCSLTVPRAPADCHLHR